MRPDDRQHSLFLALESAEECALVRKALGNLCSKSSIAVLSTRAELDVLLAARDTGVLFTSLGAFGFHDTELIGFAHSTNPRMAIVIVEPSLTARAAISAVKAGAADAVSTSNEDLQRIPEILASLHDSRTPNQTANFSREDDSLLNTVIDNLHAYIYIRDLDGRFVLNNRPNVRMLGATSESETIGKTVFDYFPVETARQFDLDDKRVLKTGQPLVNRETPYSNPAGNEGWLQTTKIPLRDEHGKINGVIGISRDITKRKRAQVSSRKASNATANSSILRPRLHHARAGQQTVQLHRQYHDDPTGWQ